MKKRTYYGVGEIAEELGVSQQAVSNWLSRGKIPKPRTRLRMGPVWRNEGDFAKWLRRKRNELAAAKEAS